MYYVDDPTTLDYVFGITLILGRDGGPRAGRRELALTVTAALFLLYMV